MSAREGTLTRGGLFDLPTSSLGWASAALFATGIVLIVLGQTVFESFSVSIGQLNVVGAVVFLVLLVAAITGAIALVKNHERSWLVWLSTALPAIAIGFEVVAMLVGGE